MNTIGFFNERIKDEFLLSRKKEQNRQQIYSAEYTLKKISATEFSLDRDVAEMSPEEIYENLFLDDYPFEASARKQFVVINDYKAWCTNNHVFKNVNAELLRYADIPNRVFVACMHKHLYISPEEMINDLLSLYPLTNGNPQVPVCCLIWTGLSLVDISDLKEEQVCLQDGKIYNKERKVIADNIDDKIIEVLKLFKSTKVATRKKVVPWGESPYPYKAYPVYNGYFITPFRKNVSETFPVDIPGVMKEMDKACRGYFSRTGNTLKLDTRYIALSGRFHRLWVMEASSVDLRHLGAKRVKEAFGQTMNMIQILKQYECYKHFRNDCKNK